MGWFWGSNGNGNDPTTTLDPDLKQFLDDQPSKPYVPAEAPQPKKNEDAEVKRPPLPDTNKTFEDRPLPRESLFQDGRYKDIWKTYVSQHEIAAVTSNPVEQMLTAKKDRRAMIHQAALENCAFEQELQQNCASKGDVTNRVRAKMTMCRQETKAFNRCYQLQAKFLQALGFMTSARTSNEDEERIQMHADKLYHRMMDYEEAVDQAKRNQQPIPPLSSLFDPSRPAPTIEQIALPKSMEDKMKRPLHELPAHERELAARAAMQEAEVANVHLEDFYKYTTTMNEDRKKRQQWLVNTFGEAVGKFLIPDPPPSTAMKAHREEPIQKNM